MARDGVRIRVIATVTLAVMGLLTVTLACTSPAPAVSPTATATAASVPATKPASSSAKSGQSSTQWQPPSSIVVASAGTTSQMYVYAVALFSGITDDTNVRFFVTPAESVVSRVKLVKNKEASFAHDTATGQYIAIEGLLDYQEMGSQKLRTVWIGAPNPQGMAARADSGIKKPADIKGKRFADYRKTYPMIGLYSDAFLAYANLTWGDVIATPVDGISGGYQALINGSVDVAVMSGFSSPAEELANSIHGLQWLDMPATEKDAWARFTKILPTFAPFKMTGGAGVSSDKPSEVWSWSSRFVGFDWTDDDLAYWFTKQMHQSFNTYKDRHAALKDWTIQQSVDMGEFFAPFHPGTVRYFKEAGVWTDEHEKRQASLLAKY